MTTLAKAEVRPVVLKSVDSQATIECNEKIAAALVASGKYIRVEANPPIKDSGA